MILQCSVWNLRNLQATMINNLFAICAERNETIRMRSDKALSLSDFLVVEKSRRDANIKCECQAADIDFIDISCSCVKKLLGDEAATGIKNALAAKAICTADHHGALYCAQSFQGDILFSRLLKIMGHSARYIPVFSTGIVELENSAYARGICTYMDRRGKRFFPFFPAKDSVRLACTTAGIDDVLTGRAKKRIQKESEGKEREVLLSLCEDIYSSYDVAGCASFSEQTMLIGEKLSGKIFGEDGPVFVYIQLEDIVKELLKKELFDEKTLCYKVLFDEGVVDYLQELKEHLFIAVDEKGRKISLTLSEGRLVGEDWRGNSVEYEASPENILALMEEDVLWPDTLVSALVLFFERGITWYGGIFQSVYLPKWQGILADAFLQAGLEKDAKYIKSFDCGGYISGPTFAMYEDRDFAVCAGPVECLVSGIDYEDMNRQIDSINMYDAHIRGLSEIYFDLVYRNERVDDWYERIGEYNYRQCCS